MEFILYISLSPFAKRTNCNLRCIQISLLHRRRFGAVVLGQNGFHCGHAEVGGAGTLCAGVRNTSEHSSATGPRRVPGIWSLTVPSALKNNSLE